MIHLRISRGSSSQRRLRRTFSVFAAIRDSTHVNQTSSGLRSGGGRDDPVLVLHEAHPQVTAIAGQEIAAVELQHVDVEPPGSGGHGELVLSVKGRVEGPGNPAAPRTGGETGLFTPAALGAVIQQAPPEGNQVLPAPGFLVLREF